MEAVFQLARRSARFMDLCSGLGIDSVILVDIDALLLELLLEPRCGWVASSTGGCPLQVIAALEAFVADLISCQEINLERLYFLSFEAQAQAWGDPSIQLLRLTAVEFLSAQGTTVHEVQSWSSEAFSGLLQQYNVAFVLTSDVGGSVSQRGVQAISTILAAQATYGCSSGQWNSAFLSQLGVADGRAFGFRTLGTWPNKDCKAAALEIAEACIYLEEGTSPPPFRSAACWKAEGSNCNAYGLCTMSCLYAWSTLPHCPEISVMMIS